MSRRRWLHSVPCRRVRLVPVVGIVALVVVSYAVVSLVDGGVRRVVRAPLAVASAAERTSARARETPGAEDRSARRRSARHRHRREERLRAVTVSPWIPPGSRPGHGRRAPEVLSAAQELADIGRLPTGWHASVGTFRSGGQIRNYLVVAPAQAVAGGHDLPLYVVLHGRNTNPASMERHTDLAPVTGPAVLVFPAGYEDSWNAGACCGYAHADGIDDVAFLHAVVARVLSRYPSVSPRRVYALGFSNGGRMAYRLACDLPGTFAGIAVVEAVPVFDCARLRPLDVEIIAQRRDPLLTIATTAAPKRTDGYVEPTVESTVERWRSLDDCAGPVSVGSIGDATTETWGCGHGTRLQYTLYPGGGHRWPRGRRAPPGGSARSASPSADQVILSFVDPPGPLTP